MKSVTQCELRSDNSYQLAWIDSRAARIGNAVLLPESSDPKRVWTVAATYSTRTDAPHSEGGIRRHRQNTGDAMPKSLFKQQ